MLYIDLFLLTIFLFTNSVTSKETSDIKDVHTGEVIEARYHFNHPPSAQYYNPIPVAVVYDEESGYSGKLEATTQAKNSDENIRQITTEREETTPITVKTTNNKLTKVGLKPQPRALNELQIPVVVLYDNDSNVLQTLQRTKSDTNEEGNSRKRVIKRRKQQVISTTDIPTETSTQENLSIKKITEVVTKNPETNAKPFMKRLQGRDPIIPIIESESYVFSHSGNFHYRYEGGDGTIAYSEGKLKKVDDDTGEAVVGGFSYTDKEGNDFSLSYTADENGYRPVGAHLPTPPPIPPAIARALQYLATATPEPVTKPPGKPGSL